MDRLLDLLTAAGVPDDQPGSAPCLQAGLGSVEPALVLVASARGEAFTEVYRRPGTSWPTATLVAELAQRMARRQTYTKRLVCEGVAYQVVAVRLARSPSSDWAICVLERSPKHRQTRSHRQGRDRCGRAGRRDRNPEENWASLVLCALARSTLHQAGEAHRLRMRVEQLLAEQQNLRQSHEQAMTAAIEQREERLREQRAHLEELKRLHAQNAMILNSAAEGIVGLDRQGRVIFVNPAAASMLGRTVPELLGRRLHEAVCPAGSESGSSLPEIVPLNSATPDRPAGFHRDPVFWRKDGTSFPVECSATPMLEKGETIGAVLTFRDISQRRMLEAKLRQAQKLESIGQLAAGIAHEINTPTQYVSHNTRFLQDAFADLMAIIAECERLRALAAQPAIPGEALGPLVQAMSRADLAYLADQVPKAIRESLDGLDQVANIVRSMKEFSHPGGDEKQAVDINRAIENTVSVSHNEWKYVAEVRADLDRSLPLVPCYPAELNQVLLNLIINAAHAIGEKVGPSPKEKGIITVSTRRDGAWVEIRVADTGTGIPEPIRQRVYDPFFTTKPVGKGTGQGLAIAHSIVCDKHQGSISFETEVGCGTTFIVRLPLGENAEASCHA